MTGNAFGNIFRWTSFGESHGVAIGGVIEGVPACIDIDVSEIQTALNKRKPGQSVWTTQRKESDTVEILSGVFDGKTTGTPIGFIIKNENQHSADYENIRDKFRPAHADMPYFFKYQNRDYRGGGRASARETAVRVVAGAFAEKVLQHFIKTPFSIQAGLVQIGNKKTTVWNDKEIENNAFFCPDKDAVPVFENYLKEIKEKQTSVGAKIEIKASGFPVGLGEPVYDRLDADIAKAMMSINAVKGVEIGDGFDCVEMTGDENADEMFFDENAPNNIGFKSNHSGGILGGLSTGQTIITRIAIKPTPSISLPLQTVTTSKQNIEIKTLGRHDPCIGIRAVPVAKAMMACVLADSLLRYRAQHPL